MTVSPPHRSFTVLLAVVGLLQIAAEPSGFDRRWPEIVALLEAGAPGGDAAGLRRAREDLRSALETISEPRQEVSARYSLAYSDAFIAVLSSSPEEKARLLEEAVLELQKALKSDPKYAEAHTLSALVLALLIDTPGSNPDTLGLEAIGAVSRAEQLDPGNPRVALLQGIGAVLVPAAYGGGLDRAETWLREAVRLFDREPRDKPWPNWGRYEAHLWLHHVLAKRGDAEGARREKSLALAESPLGRSLYPLKEKRSPGEFEAFELFSQAMNRLARAMREGGGERIAAFFGEGARLSLPEPVATLAPKARWIQQHGWRSARGRQMTRSEIGASWDALRGHFVEVEDVRLNVQEIRFDDRYAAAAARVAISLVGRDKAGRREWLQGPLAIKAARSEGDRWLLEDLDAVGLESMVSTTDLFTEVSAAVGLGGQKGSNGAAAGDIDNDGYVDLVVAGPRGLHLYRNDGKGGFVDRAREAGVAEIPNSPMGVLLVDVDNDGDLDLFVTSAGEQMLFENRLVPDGALRLVDMSQEAGVAVHTVAYSAAAGDINDDGRPDIYVCGYNRWEQTVPNSFFGATNGTPNLLFVNQGGGRFREMAHELGVDKPADDRRWSYDAELVDIDGDGDLDLYVVNDFGENLLYRNLLKETGRPGFRDVAREVGATRFGFGMGVSFGDYNNDGLLDIHATYLSSPAVEPLARLFPPAPSEADVILRVLSGNGLYENLGSGTFKEVTDSVGPFRGGWAWGGGFIDFDNDGWQDLHSTNGMISGGERDVMPTFAYGLLSGSGPRGQERRAHASGMVIDPMVSGVFLDRRASAAPGPSSPANTPIVDATYARPYTPPRSPGPAGPGGRGSRALELGMDWIGGGERSFAGYERDTLYLNLRNGHFLDLSGVSGLDSITDGRAVVYADFDNDGDPDVFVTTLSGNVHFRKMSAAGIGSGDLLFRNNVGQDSGHVRVTLVGGKSGRDAFGSVVRLKSSAGIQAKVKAGGEGHLSQHDPRLLFGLGQDKEAEWLEVTWPSGLRQRFEHVRAGHSVRITEGSERLEVLTERKWPSGPTQARK